MTKPDIRCSEVSIVMRQKSSTTSLHLATEDKPKKTAIVMAVVVACFYQFELCWQGYTGKAQQFERSLRCCFGTLSSPMALSMFSTRSSRQILLISLRTTSTQADENWLSSGLFLSANPLMRFDSSVYDCLWLILKQPKYLPKISDVLATTIAFSMCKLSTRSRYSCCRRE